MVIKIREIRSWDPFEKVRWEEFMEKVSFLVWSETEMEWCSESGDDDDNDDELYEMTGWLSGI